MKPTRVVVIGLGGAGRAHLSYFKETGLAEIVGVVDPEVEKHRDMLFSLGLGNAKTFATVDELRDMTSLDAVSICSPDETHFEYALKFLEAKVNVLCEKPVITSVSEGEKLIRAVKDSGMVFASFHQLRFHKPYEIAKYIISTGEIGEIFCIEGDYVHSLRDRAGMFHDWRLKKPFGQPPQLGGGIHFTDLFLWLLEDEIQEYHSYSNNVSFPAYPDCDCVMSIMRFKRGCVARTLTAFGASMPQNFKLRVYGTKGTIIDNQVFLGERFDRFTSLPKGGIKQTIITELIKRWPLPTFRDFPFYGYEHRPPCVATVRDFLAAIRTGSVPRCDVISGVKASLASLYQTESYRLGKSVNG